MEAMCLSVARLAEASKGKLRRAGGLFDVPLNESDVATIAEQAAKISTAERQAYRERDAEVAQLRAPPTMTPLCSLALH